MKTVPNAMEALIAAHKNDLYRYCIGMLRDVHTAEDACQEVFLRAHRSLSTFKGDSAERTWLTAIAINVCRDFLRQSKRRAIAGAPLDTNTIAWRDPENQGLYEAISNLPAKQKTVILLYYHQGFNCHEIAKMLRIRESTVSTHLVRARQALARKLNSDGGET